MNRFALVVLASGLFVVSILTWSTGTSQVVTPLSQKEFAAPELMFGTSLLRLDQALTRLSNSGAWSQFLASQPSDVGVYIDPRSGTPATIILSVPLIPGTGKGNSLTLTELGARLGRSVQEVSAAEVADAVKNYITANRDVLAIATDQMDPVVAGKATDDLWHVSIPQQVNGVPVRHSRLVAVINHGNLVLVGTEGWGNVAVSTVPTIAAATALQSGFAYAGGRQPNDTVWKEPALELVPYEPQGWRPESGPLGQGYGHRLAWVFGFERAGQIGRWEVTVDARSGEVAAFEDRNLYVKRTVKGGVYPAMSTGSGSGEMQPNYPMPWADFRRCSNSTTQVCTVDTDCPPGGVCQIFFTNGAGVFDLGAGVNATTTLRGQYVKTQTPCDGDILAPLIASSTADIDLGGDNNQHECDVSPPPAPSHADNVPPLRTAFYETNKIAEIGRGWLPANNWLKGLPAPTTMIVNKLLSDCKATAVGGSTANFGRLGTTNPCGNRPIDCLNPGENASTIDHEWGHLLDDNDSGGSLSNTTEAYADIAAIFRQQASCIGRGLSAGSDQFGCQDAPSTGGSNVNLAHGGCETTPTHCTTDCSGIREADYGKHVGGVPDTPRNFVFDSCDLGSSLCDRESHCAGAPVIQAAWDLATRDLTSPPFSYDSGTAFIVANKLFHQGSGNIGNWYECNSTSTVRTSSGCGSGAGYIQWLATDDDNGDLNDGTPHMSALYAAFHRHEIACSPNVSAAADHQIEWGTIVPPTNFNDTVSSDDEREILEEGLVGGNSRLCHVWRFAGLEADTPRTLIREGHRPTNTEGDDFQFYWSNSDITCTSGTGWTPISGAEIKSSSDGLPKPHSFGGGYSATVYIKVADTVATGGILDRVHVDLLAIGQNRPIPQDSGCVLGPTQAPTLSPPVAGSYQVSLSWTPVTGAVKYWVFRTEGHAGCNLGKSLIATPTATSYIDGEVAAGRQYCYAVIAAGGTGSEASQCFGLSSACQCVTPTL